jgi:hypothetical protein
MKRFRWAGLAAILCAGVATSALVTSMTFGGDLSDYQAAPGCAPGQHASSTTCRETTQETVSSTSSESPCAVNFNNVSTTTYIDCGPVWQGLQKGSTATVVLWHDDVVTISDAAGSQETTSYPVSTGPWFFGFSIVLGVVALLLTALWWAGKRSDEAAPVQLKTPSNV